MTEKETSLRQLCLKCVVALINKFTDKEAFYRSFVALGNLISYEGSFFIPKPVIDTLKELYYANAIKGSQAHDCLIHLLRCFQGVCKIEFYEVISNPYNSSNFRFFVLYLVWFIDFRSFKQTECYVLAICLIIFWIYLLV